MSYEDTEIAAAVERTVSAGIQFEYDSLGVRKTGSSFEALKAASAGLLVSSPAAPFYIVRIARDRLLEVLLSMRTDIGVLDRYAMAMGRTVTPVESLSSLYNAKTALEALAQATAKRTGVYQSIENVPAFMRFDRNSQRFLEEEGRKINNAGSIVETPDQARSLIRPAARALRSRYDKLFISIATLQNSIPSVQALNLPATLSRMVIEQAGDVLAERTEALSALTPEGRLMVLRDTVLDVLSARSAVRGFGSLQPVTTFATLEGVGGLFADADHPATPASLIAGRNSGYVVSDDARYLEFLVDGAYTILYPAPGSYRGTIGLVGRWPREVVLGITQFLIVRETEALEYTFPINLAPGLFTAASFVAEVNTQLAASLSEVEAVLSFLSARTSEGVDISGAGPLGVTFTAPAIVDFAALGVVPGDLLFIEDDASTGYRSIYSVTSALANVVTADRLSGTSAAGDVDVLITIGALDYAYPSLRLTSFTADVGVRASLIVRDVDDGTCISLGVASGSASTSTRTSARSIQDDLNVQAYTFVDGANRLEASTAFVESAVASSARSHPEDPTAISIYLYRGRATVAVDGATPQLLLLDPVPETVDAVSKALIVRESPIAADVGDHGELTGVTGATIELAMEAPLLAAPGSELLVEIGWNFYALYGYYRRDSRIVVEEGIVQSGIYSVMDYAVSPATSLKLPLEVLVDRVVPGNAQGGFQPAFFTATLGQYRSVFRSLSVGLDTRVEAHTALSSPLHSRVFTHSPVTAVGSTRWVQLPYMSTQVEVGDVLEIHLTNPVTPTVAIPIDLIEAESSLVRLAVPVATDLASSLTFSTTGVVPFARIRKSVKQNFDAMADSIAAWLALPQNNLMNMFHRLDALINEALAGGISPASKVGALRSYLTAMTADLQSLESALLSYEAPIVEAVDTLIGGFKERGADRALDALLSGDFSSFFGIGALDASYSGTLQEALRTVQREDLPVRKDNRGTSAQSYEAAVTASITDWDPGYVVDDAAPVDEVDVPEFNSAFPVIPVP